MVARAGEYFELPVKGYHSVNQRDPQYLTSFNVVVGVKIRHWVKVVEPTAGGLEGPDLLAGEFKAYFYANDGLVASTQPESIYREFNVLTGLFDRVILRTNRRKTVSMACHPLHASVWMSSEAYEQQKMGTGTIF